MKSGFIILSLSSLAAALASAQLREPDTTFYGRVLHHGGGEPHVITSGSLAWSIVPPDGGGSVTVKADLTSWKKGAYSYSLRVPRHVAVSGLPEYSVPAGLPVLSDTTQRYRHADIKVNGQAARLADPAALSFRTDGAERADFVRVDLIVDFPLADTDTDGLPDWWEEKYGLDSQNAAAASADSDGDGLSDLAEYRAGTNPSLVGTAPLIAGSLIVSIPENGRAALLLKAQDSDSPASQLRYKVTGLPSGVSLFVRDGLADGRSDLAVGMDGSFTQAEVDAGRVFFTAVAPLRDASATFSLVDEVPGRTPVSATLQLSSVTRSQLGDAGGLRDSLLPANFTLHFAGASAVPVFLRAPSGPVETNDVLTANAYAANWQPQHGADEARVFIGSPLNDTLLGSGENDLLAAGAGDNTLRGYAGADRFVFTKTGVRDTVTDFSPEEHDVLDVAALIQPGAGTLGRYLSMENGVLRVDANGDGSGFTDASITLTSAGIPASLDEAWDAGLIDAGSVVPRTSLFISATSASEEGLSAGQITLRRRGDASQPLTIALSITGTATIGIDYVSIPTSVTFAAGQKIIILPVTPLADDVRETLETIQIALTANPAYDIGNSSSTVNLTDLPSRVWLEVTERSAYKDSLSPAQVLIRRSGTLGSPLTAVIQTSGRATPAVDYRRPASSLTFAAGQDVLTLDIVPLASATLTNGCEDVILNVRADANYEFGSTPQARVVICERPQTLAAWRTAKLPGRDPHDEAFYESDTDGDGFNGLMEFALNLNPASRDSGEKTQTKLILSSNGQPGLEYRRWPGAPEIRYEVWQSADLQNWRSLTTADSIESSATLEPDGLERVQHFLRGKPANGKVYLRLKVIRP